MWYLNKNNPRLYPQFRKLCFWMILLLGGATQYANAQMYGNEWINYSQTYYKIPVIQDGIYHVDSLTLANAGINVGVFDVRNLQLFFRGEEIPIYVQDDGDFVFESGEYIEFFGERNDGWFDSTIYINGSQDMLDPGVSLFNDTSIYYITWNSSITNLRYTVETDTNFSAYTASPYYYYKTFQGFTNNYYGGAVYSQLNSPEYTEGEGYCLLFTESTTHTFLGDWNSTQLTGVQPNLYLSSPPPTRLRFYMATCNDPSTLWDHHHRIDVADGTQVFEDTMGGYNYYQQEFIVPTTSFGTSTNAFRIDFLTTFSAITRSALGYWEMNVPQVFNLANRIRQDMYLPDNTADSKARLDIVNFNSQSSPTWIFDVTNNKKITVVDNAGTLQALVPNDGGPYNKRLHISSEAAVINVTSVKPVSTDPTHYAMFRDFESLPLADNTYIILTSAKLWNSAQD